METIKSFIPVVIFLGLLIAYIGYRSDKGNSSTESSSADNQFLDLIEMASGFRFFKVGAAGPDLSFSLKCEDHENQDALGEVKLFKKFVQAKKKEVNQHLKSRRAENRVKMANMGPASLNAGALMFKGTKAGSFFRTVGTSNRASIRASLANELKPYENMILSYDQIILACDRVENQVKADIIAGR